MAYLCKAADCTYQAEKRQSVMKHAYNHVPSDKWPYKCPLRECRWFGRFPGEFDVHHKGKHHQRHLKTYPSPEAKVIPNPKHIALKDADWVECTRTVTALTDSTNLPPPEKKRKHATDDAVKKNTTRCLPPLAVKTSQAGTSSTTNQDVPTPTRDEELDTNFDIAGLAAEWGITLPSVVTPAGTENIAEADSEIDAGILDEWLDELPVCPEELLQSASANTSSSDIDNLGQEFHTTRKDLSHHFLSLTESLEKHFTHGLRAMESLSAKFEKVVTNTTQMETWSRAAVSIACESHTSLRLKLAGTVDELHRILSKLHGHEYGYVPDCATCKKNAYLIKLMVNINVPELLDPQVRETSFIK